MVRYLIGGRDDQLDENEWSAAILPPSYCWPISPDRIMGCPFPDCGTHHAIFLIEKLHAPISNLYRRRRRLEGPHRGQDPLHAFMLKGANQLIKIQPRVVTIICNKIGADNRFLSRSYPVSMS